MATPLVILPLDPAIKTLQCNESCLPHEGGGLPKLLKPVRHGEARQCLNQLNQETRSEGIGDISNPDRKDFT